MVSDKNKMEELKNKKKEKSEKPARILDFAFRMSYLCRVVDNREFIRLVF